MIKKVESKVIRTSVSTRRSGGSVNSKGKSRASGTGKKGPVVHKVEASRKKVSAISLEDMDFQVDQGESWGIFEVYRQRKQYPIGTILDLAA